MHKSIKLFNVSMTTEKKAMTFLKYIRLGLTHYDFFTHVKL